MPQWKQSLTKSLHQTRSTPESRYFQLATVDNDGFPFCRTVVYRGLTDNNQLVVVSDTRTEKYQQLMQNQYAEACWYFAKTREQYRFRCTGSIVTVLDDQPLVSAHWNKLSDAGKKQFLWGEPGSERTSDSALQVIGDFQDVPSHFCVLLLQINKVDYLNLRGNPQCREWFYKNSEGTWVSQSVIP